MGKHLVIDASFAFRLIFPGPHQKRCQTMVTQWQREGYALCAPTLWLYEITSALCKGVHFGQITRDEGQQALTLAQKLDVQLFPPDDAQTTLASDWAMRLPSRVPCFIFIEHVHPDFLHLAPQGRLDAGRCNLFQDHDALLSFHSLSLSWPGAVDQLLSRGCLHPRSWGYTLGQTLKQDSAPRTSLASFPRTPK